MSLHPGAPKMRFAQISDGKFARHIFLPLDPLLYCERGHRFSWGEIFQLKIDGDSQIISSRPQNNASITVNLGLC